MDASTPETAKPRVVFISRKWGPAIGGMETYCERLTEELAKIQPVDVIALKGRDNGQPPSIFALLSFPFTVIVRLFAMATDRASQEPEIVHLGDMAIWPLALMARLFFPSARIVLSAHGTDVAYGARGGLKGSAYAAFLSLGARLLSKARVIANSRATRDRLLSINWNSDAVVPLATDLRSDPAEEIDTDRIVFAGRLVRRKGLHWFVSNVLPLLPETARISVIGTRWDETENAALNHQQVEFLGPKPQAELAQYFAKAACVIVPNIEIENGEYEGFGLVAPEAASAGGVVLAAASGGLRDAVIDGETGFQLPAGDAQAWAKKIAEIASWSETDRAAFVSQSTAKAQEHYSWSRVAADTSAAYSD
ncbi:MAG: glycosyltransferase family 4 protein [Erythrobacter sp.]